MARRLMQVTAGTLLGVAVVAVALRLASGPPPQDSAAGDPHILSAAYPAGPLGLTTHTGGHLELAGLDRPLTVVFFGYTHCPDVCPATLASLTRAVEALGGIGRQVGGVFVSVDPARDTPERLARYMGAFHPDFVALAGTEDEVRRVTGGWGVFHQVAEEGRTHEGYLVDHSARAFVVDDEGSIVASFPPYTSAEAMAATLRRLLEAR